MTAMCAYVAPQAARRREGHFGAWRSAAALPPMIGSLGELDLVAVMIDRVHFGEHVCVVALGIGIGIDGTKHPLGLAEGSTENIAVVTDLLTELRDRGLDTTRPIFVGIDGGKALRAAVVWRGVNSSPHG